MTVLPGQDQPHPLKVSLQLIADLENEYGSLYQLGEKLLDKSLPLNCTIAALKMLYRHAGCRLAEDVLEAFLLRQPCVDILAGVLVDILLPMETAEKNPLAQFMDEMMKKFPDAKEG